MHCKKSVFFCGTKDKVMGFRAEKLKLERKIGKIKIICLAVFAVIFTAFILFSCFCPPETWKYHVAKPSVEKNGEGELRITYLNVGQGDATLIRFPDGQVMLIDGGAEGGDSSLSLMRYLNAAKIDTIDYLVLTHTDSDHSGGLVEVVKYKEVKKAYLPFVSSVNVNNAFSRLCTQLQKKNVPIFTADRSFKVDSLLEEYPYSVHCLSPNVGAQESENSNENSCVVYLSYGEFGALFCGDAPSSIEEKIIREYSLGLLNIDGLCDTEILKVSHHGSSNGTSTEFLNFLGVENAVISVGENNPYGHPSTDVLVRLQANGTNVFRTDKNGHILAVVSSDGNYTLSGERE